MNMQKIELIDSHCHIHDADFPVPTDEVLALAEQAGVAQMVVIGTNEQSSRRAVEFAKSHEQIWATVGTHPHDASAGCEYLRTLDLTDPKIVAIGEIGLDYHYDFSPREVQQQVLRQQLMVAIEADLPIVFHVREAFDDFWPIFDEMAMRAQAKGRVLRGVVHSFSDNLVNLQMALERGLYIGVNGIATFTKDKSQLEAFRAVPLDKLLIETDAPYLAPKGRRGKPNQPAYVREVAEWLADFYGVELAELATVTMANARRLFGI
jgi:hydrolase, tatD family